MSTDRTAVDEATKNEFRASSRKETGLLVGCSITLPYASNVMHGGIRFRPSGRDKPRQSTDRLRIHRIGKMTVNAMNRHSTWNST